MLRKKTQRWIDPSVTFMPPSLLFSWFPACLSWRGRDGTTMETPALSNSSSWVTFSNLACLHPCAHTLSKEKPGERQLNEPFPAPSHHPLLYVRSISRGPSQHGAATNRLQAPSSRETPPTTRTHPSTVAPDLSGPTETKATQDEPKNAALDSTTRGEPSFGHRGCEVR